MIPKHSFLLLFMSFCLFAYSQDQNKSVSLSVTASPFPTKSSENKDIGVIGKLSLEFHTSNKLSFQGSFFTSNNVFFKNDNNHQINSYGFIPSVQYYFLDHPKFNVFGQLGYGFGFEDQTLYGGKVENSALTIFSIGGGLNYKLKNKLDLQLNLPYFKAKNKTINKESASGLGVFIGLNFIIK